MLRMTRRRFLKIAAAGSVGVGASVTGYSLCEAGWVSVAEQSIPVKRLPSGFTGFKICFLTDIHHGPWTSLSYVDAVVDRANLLNADVILLGGDYVHRHHKYIQPCFNSLKHLRAPAGVFGVLGNHDHWESAPETRAAMKVSGIRELTNDGCFLASGNQRLRICGVGDLWEDTQDLQAALGDTNPEESAIVLSHNPDYAEQIRDPRVGLVLSGHTHGGQVVLPVIGAPFVPSRYGQKYLRGLVQAPHTQVFISRGLGTITPPLRFCCRPEINLITLTQG